MVSWLKYHPQNLLGLDYFNYSKAWRTVTDVFQKEYPRTAISFQQGDLTDLSIFPEREFDIVGSDAVFEHLKEPSKVCREWYRILKPGGILYATFGPLWYGWHGDHFSGWDCFENGFNHIVLSKQEYEDYLAQRTFTEHSEDDGRTWIENGLFSYLKPAQYLEVLAASGFERRHVGVIIEPPALKCLKHRPALKHELTRQHSLMDLLICGMTVIYQKPKLVV
jgi:ubiquinone/menaquinone biosynthesis C-methylase UbiE